MLALAVHAVAGDIPTDHASGLNQKLRQTSATAPSALAEAAERTLEHEKQQCYHMARAATYQLHQHLMAAYELKLISEKQFRSLVKQAASTYKVVTALAQPK